MPDGLVAYPVPLISMLQLAVISVWNHHQHQILSAITKKDCPLTVGGDGRADSPGHSANMDHMVLLTWIQTKFYISNLYRYNCQAYTLMFQLNF